MPASELRIVIATLEERAFVARLSREVFARFGPYEHMLPEMMAQRGVTTLVAWSGEEPVGFAMFAFTSAKEADLLAIATLPEWQTRGVGRALLQQVEADVSLARVGKKAWLRLNVAVDNLTARRFFEASAFLPLRGRGGLYPAGQRSIGMRKVVRA